MSYREGEPHPAADLEFKKAGIERLMNEKMEAEAVDGLKGMVHELTRSGNTEEAVQLVEMVEPRMKKLSPELQAHFNNIAGEAHFYASDFENAETAFGATAKADLQKFPESEKKITPELKDAWSRTIHAQGRLGDVTFLSGRYAAAADRFKEQIATQELSPIEPVGTRACALYGLAASEYMKGEIAHCLESLAAAKTLLEGAPGDESVLMGNIENLEDAAEAMDEVDEEKQEALRGAIHEMLQRRGGSGGGVKRIDFRELFDAAVVEQELAQEEE